MSFLKTTLDKAEEEKQAEAQITPGLIPLKALATSEVDEPHIAYYVGLMAGISASIAFFPQVVSVFKNKTASGLTYLTLAICLLGELLWITYGTMTKDRVLAFFSLIALTLYLLLLISKFVYPNSH